MRVLLFADANSYWTLSFVNNVLIRDDVELIVFSENLLQMPPLFYQQKEIQILSYSQEEKEIMRSLNKIKQNKIRKKYIKFIRKYGFFDVINVQFVKYSNVWMALQLAGENTKIVLSYWGSDLFRMPRFHLQRIKKLIKGVHYVTFDNIDLQTKFLKEYGKVFQGEFECAYFGLPILDNIDVLLKNKSKTIIKNEMGIDEEQIIIAVGYNGIEPQQHFKVLQSIERLPERLKEKIVIFLQMTYGGTSEYRERVIAQAKKTVGNVKTFLETLSDEEVAKIRLATDIYINAQTTDAFSGSVCENFYCANLVVNASWLKYEELEKYNVTYLEFDDFVSLSMILEEYLEGKISVSTLENKEKIEKLRSWKYCKEKWNQILFDN